MSDTRHHATLRNTGPGSRRRRSDWFACGDRGRDRDGSDPQHAFERRRTWQRRSNHHLDRYHIINQFKQRERVVIIDPAQTYYISPLLQFSEAKDLHAQQAELATFTFLQRNPKDFDTRNCCGRCS